MKNPKCGLAICPESVSVVDGGKCWYWCKKMAGNDGSVRVYAEQPCEQLEMKDCPLLLEVT